MLYASSPPTHTQHYPAHTHTHTVTHTLKLYFPSAVRGRLRGPDWAVWSSAMARVSQSACLASSVGIYIVPELHLLVLPCCFRQPYCCPLPPLYLTSCNKQTQTVFISQHVQAKPTFHPLHAKLKGPRCLQTDKGYFAWAVFCFLNDSAVEQRSVKRIFSTTTLIYMLPIAFPPPKKKNPQHSKCKWGTFPLAGLEQTNKAALWHLEGGVTDHGLEVRTN